MTDENISNLPEIGQFIGYASSGPHDEDDPSPIATGTTKAACMDLTVQRALAMMLLHGSICIQRRDEVPADIFHQLGKTLDKFCAEKGLPMPATAEA